MIPMTRRVRDDFEALLFFEAVEEVGGEPISVVVDPNPAYPDHRRWVVFARVPAERDINKVDQALAKKLPKV